MALLDCRPTINDQSDPSLISSICAVKHLRELVIRRPIWQYHRLLNEFVPPELGDDDDPQRPVQERDGEDREAHSAVRRVPEGDVAAVAATRGRIPRHDEQEDVYEA